MLGHKNILKLIANARSYIADVVTFVKMLFNLIKIFVVYVFKFREVLFTNLTLQMSWYSQMGPKSIDIIISRFTKVTPRMIEYELMFLTVLTFLEVGS